MRSICAHIRLHDTPVHARLRTICAHVRLCGVRVCIHLCVICILLRHARACIRLCCTYVRVRLHGVCVCLHGICVRLRGIRVCVHLRVARACLRGSCILLRCVWPLFRSDARAFRLPELFGLNRLRFRLGLLFAFLRVVTVQTRGFADHFNFARLHLFAVDDIIQHRHHEQRHQRRVGQAADYDHRHRLHHFRALAGAERHGGHAENRGQRRHQDRAQADSAGFNQCLALRHAADAHLVYAVDEHDAVIHDYARQHQEADHGDDREIHAGDQQRREAAGKRQRQREHDDDRRFERLELRHHDQEDQHNCNDQHEHQIAHNARDHLVLARERDFIAVRGCVFVQLLFQLVADMVRRVSLGHIEAHRDHALLILARNAGEALALLYGRDVADAHHFALLAERGLHFEILEVVRRNARIAAVEHVDRKVLSIERRLRNFGLARQLRGQKLNHLADGQALVDRLFLVHRNAHFRNRRLQAVAYVRRAVDRAHDFRDVRRNCAQRVHVVAAHLYGDARSGQHGDVHRAGLNGEVQVHVLRNGADVARDVHIAASRVGIHDDVIGKRASAIAGQHAHRAAGIQAHGLNAADIADAIHQLNRLRALLGLVLLIVQRERRGHLRGIDLGHERHAHLRHLQHRDRQQRNRHQQHQRLKPQRSLQQAGIAALNRAEHRLFAHLLLALEQRRRHGRNQRHRHNQARQQRIRDRKADIGEQIVRHAGYEHDRQEHAYRRERRCEQRARNLAHALNTRGQYRQMLLVAQAIDILNGDD